MMQLLNALVLRSQQCTEWKVQDLDLPHSFSGLASQGLAKMGRRLMTSEHVTRLPVKPSPSVPIRCLTTLVFLLALLVVRPSGSAAVASTAGKPSAAGVAFPSRSCAPPLRRSHRLVAPGVRLIRSWTTAGSCRTMIHVATRGPGGVLWGLDTSSNLWRSSNNGTTWTRVW